MTFDEWWNKNMAQNYTSTQARRRFKQCWEVAQQQAADRYAVIAENIDGACQQNYHCDCDSEIAKAIRKEFGL